MQLGQNRDRGNSPVLLSQYDGFVLFVQPGELIPPGSLGGLYTDTPRGGGLLKGYHPFAWTSSLLSFCLSTGRAPRLAPACPPDQSDVVPHD